MQEVADKLTGFFLEAKPDKAKVDEHLEKAKALLENGESLSAEDYWTWDLLNCVVFEKRLDILELMMMNGLKVDDTNGAEKKTPLHFAAYAGDADGVRHLMMREANVNAKDNKNRTPADLAKNSGYQTIAKSLDPEIESHTDSQHTLLPSPKNSPTSRRSLNAEEDAEREKIQRLIESRK